MAIAIRQIHKHFVGEVSGVDLRQPLTKDEAATIEAGMDQYAVLVFHGQDIIGRPADGVRAEFRPARERRAAATSPSREDYRLATAGLNDVSNLGKDGKPLATDSRHASVQPRQLPVAFRFSFRAIPAKFSLLSARVVNPKGGNTEFADMRAGL